MSSYKYALGQLEKFNKFIIENLWLRDKFIFEEYNFLQVYQANIFFDTVSFKDKKEAETGEYRFLESNGIFQIRLRQLLAVVYSFLSYMFLIISRRKVLIYTDDRLTSRAYKCDFRMENLYRFLEEKKIKFFEILHTTYRGDFIKSLFQMRRAAMYLETVDILYKFLQRIGFFHADYSAQINSLNFEIFGEEKDFFRQILVKYLCRISQTRFRVHFMELILKPSALETLIAPLDTRNCFELIVAAKLNGIKTYGFQAGSLSKYSVGWLNCYRGGKLIKPDKVFVESDYWKKELLRLGTYFEEGEIEIGGNLKSDPIFLKVGKIPSKNKNGSELVILMSYEIFASKEEVLEYIKKFLSCPGVRIIFSLRPDRDSEEQIAEYGLKNISGNIIFTTMVKDDFDIVAGTYSTFLYEQINKFKPVLVLKTDFDYGEGMVINGIADELDINGSNFCQKLNQIKNTSVDILAQRRQRLYEGNVPLRKTLEEIFQKTIFIKTEIPW